MMVSVGTGSSTIVISGTGRPTTVTESSTTLYKEQPGTVRNILIALAIALVISTASVVWRVVRRSERLGVTGLIVAGLVGAVALLGAMTIGMSIAPLAAFLVLPIAPARKPTPAPVSASPPGWYGDPSGSALLRYWDGQTWTVHSAPMRLPG
jgi:hypothetical protein